MSWCRAETRLQMTVVRIQAMARGAHQRRSFLAARRAVVQLQAGFRGWQGRMQFLQAKGAAIWIQSCWRRYQAQRLLSQHQVQLGIHDLQLLKQSISDTQLEMLGISTRIWARQDHMAMWTPKCHSQSARQQPSQIMIDREYSATCKLASFKHTFSLVYANLGLPS